MIVVLAEKPSVARDLAAFLGAREKKEGYLEGNGYQVTWAFGHLVGLQDPEHYHPEWKRWSLQSLPMLPEQFQLKATGDSRAKKQLAIIKRLLKQADKIICATDAGREGELIFRYIIEFCGLQNKPFQRLWLSSLTNEAIAEAFVNLRPGAEFDGLFHAARCRSEADWIVGLNGTRNLTVRYGKGNLWSLGRVQTPVLAMIVDRDEEIRNFKPEPFWELMTVYRETPFKYKGKRFDSQEKGQLALEPLREGIFRVDDVKKKKERQLPPLLFNLTELQREMNRRYGASAADTLQAAQALYESKFITYPRTDSQHIPEDMKTGVSKILEGLRSRKSKETEVLDLSRLHFTKSIVNDTKVTDHHAILPTGKSPGMLSGLQEQIYDAIHTRLLAVFYPPQIKEAMTIEASVVKVEKVLGQFTAKGSLVLDPGWTILYPVNKKENDQEKESVLSQAFTVGESGPHEPYLKEGKTQAPKSFNESSLLGAMATAGKMVEDAEFREALKERGLGTPATRASIIETLLSRNYLKRDKKKLVATDRGRYLIALIQDPSLKSADLTGEWESKIKGIEEGTMEPESFMREIEEFTRSILQNSEDKPVREDLFGSCPQCGKPIIEGKKGYGCSEWKKGCNYVLWKQQENLFLQPAHARRLLQGATLYGPEGKTLLVLSKKGAFTQIPVPEAPARKIYKRKAKK